MRQHGIARGAREDGGTDKLLGRIKVFCFPLHRQGTKYSTESGQAFLLMLACKVGQQLLLLPPLAFLL